MNEPASRKLEPRMSYDQIRKNLTKLIDYDRGLNRKTVFNFDGLISEEAVLMKNRNAIIADSIDYLEKNPNGRLSFLMFDLANMYFANLSGSGDLVIARAAKELNQAVFAFIEQEKLKTTDLIIEAGRYGGDEFVVSLRGQGLTRELSEKLAEYIEQRYKKDKVEGYYKKGISGTDPIVKQPISLKEKENGHGIEIIDRPEEPGSREIFDDFIKKGLILNKEQLVKSRLANFGKMDSRKAAEELYQEGLTTVEEKLQFLSERFSNLGIAIEIRALLESDEFSQSQRAEVLGYLEKRLFDHLLGARILSFAEISKNMAYYNKVACVDLKFIKETNELYSYAEADDHIFVFYQKIRELIPQDLSNYFEIARRGGTFVIGMKRTISSFARANKVRLNEVFERIKSLNELQLDFKGIDVFIPLGSHSLTVENASRKGRLNERRFDSVDFDNLLTTAQKAFDRQMITYLMKKEADGIPNLNKIFSIGYTGFLSPFKSLIIEFFTGKRSLQRSASLLQTLMHEREFSGVEFNVLRRVMNEAFSYMKSTIELDSKEKYDQNVLFRRIKKILGS